MGSLYFNNELSSQQMKSRIKERKEDLRGAYFRDSTAIIHSYPFRRLKHKTQVFFAPKNDHICTRIEHVMHVASVSTTICRALSLNGDLAWAIGLGHDLGHTPFGHLGETILSDIMKEKKIKDGNFRHEIYSLRVIDSIARYGDGLNLTYAVRDGIVNHCGEKFEKEIMPDFEFKDLSSIKDRSYYPSTWEGCVVRMSDKIAYMGRDMEDAIGLGLITKDEIPEVVQETLGAKNGKIIDTLVTDVINYSLGEGKIGFSDKIYEAVLVLKKFNYEKIYGNLMLCGYHDSFERILRTLYNYLEYLFKTYGFDEKGYYTEKNLVSVRFYDFITKMKSFYEEVDGGFDYMIIDYIAGMSDDFAQDSIREIMTPSSFESQFDDWILKK